MQRERVSENVYWFQSEIYALVTAGAVIGPQWAAVIDTLAMPEETLMMRAFIEEEIGVPVRYVINTHYHADHSWGNCLFPGATVIAHQLCRTLMQERGTLALETARHQSPTFKQIKLVLPHLTFDNGNMNIKVGKKNLLLSASPGHSPDGITVLVEEDRVLFAGDTFLPLPYFVDGNIDELSASIKRIARLGLENIVQGHGEIILRGEIDDAAHEDLAYLSCLKKSIRTAIKRRNPEEALATINIESCGKSRVYLGGLATDLHNQNVAYLFKQAVQNPELVTK
jgi:cyclase